MGNYSKDRLALLAQGLTGRHKLWAYEDTGAIAGITEADGFITDADDMGMDTGDLVFIKATDGVKSKVVHAASMIVVQDTGATSGTVGLNTIIGDTS